MPTNEAGHDHCLLSRIARGEAQALHDLYAAYRTRLWSYLWPLLGRDAGWTEELVQDVFLAVWRSASTYRGQARVATWIFHIAHNLAVNARRDRSRRLIAESLGGDDGEAAEAASSMPSPEAMVMDRLALDEALDALSAKHREVLDLAFVQGFTMDEIAAILDVPPGTVKSRISYARRALYAQLAHPQGQEEWDRDRC